MKPFVSCDAHVDDVLKDLQLCLEAMREDHFKYPQLRLSEMQSKRMLYALELLGRL